MDTLSSIPTPPISSEQPDALLQSIRLGALDIAFMQDVPRVKTYINAYSCHRDTVRAVMDKLLGRSPFTGVSPVDPFCGLPDTRL